MRFSLQTYLYRVESIALFLVLPIINYSMHLDRILDKACINRGKDGAWSLCSRTKVEETKIVLCVLPLFISSIIRYVSNPVLFTFTVQQGGDKHKAGQDPCFPSYTVHNPHHIPDGNASNL
jgi:hypothetical protein